MRPSRSCVLIAIAIACALTACKRKVPSHTIGLALDVGGRGDQSFIDSPVLDDSGKPVTLPNVRALVFKEHEGSFLAGALAGELTRTGKIGFVGGMNLPLIQKFEAGFRAGLRAVNPAAARDALIAYTGTFDDERKGVQVGQDLYRRGCDLVFQAAGLDGLGVIKAAQQAGRLV